MPVYEHKLREELKKLSPPQRESLLAKLGEDLATGRVQLIPDPAKQSQAELQQPGFSELYSPESARQDLPEAPERTPVGEPGPGFRVNRLSMGPGRPSPIEAPAAVAGATLPAAIPTSAGGAATAAIGWGAAELAEKKLGLPWWVSELVAWRLGRGGGKRGLLKKVGDAILGGAERGAGREVAKEATEQAVKRGSHSVARSATREAAQEGAERGTGRGGNALLREVMGEAEGGAGRFVTVPGGTPLQDPAATMRAAREAAQGFGMRGRPKVWNITVNGKPVQWFKSGAQASGKFKAMLNRAGKDGLKKLGANKYQTPDGDIIETNWVQLLTALN